MRVGDLKKINLHIAEVCIYFPNQDTRRRVHCPCSFRIIAHGSRIVFEQQTGVIQWYATLERGQLNIITFCYPSSHSFVTRYMSHILFPVFKNLNDPYYHQKKKKRGSWFQDLYFCVSCLTCVNYASRITLHSCGQQRNRPVVSKNKERSLFASCGNSWNLQRNWRPFQKSRLQWETVPTAHLVRIRSACLFI